MELIQLSELNWLAIIGATLSAFFVGGIWYSIFDTPWRNANGFTAEFLQTRNMILVFVSSIALSLVMAISMALILSRLPNMDLHDVF